MLGRVVSVNVSETKGTIKSPVNEAELRREHGILGDVHAGTGNRQVSMLAIESVRRLQQQFEGKQQELPKCNSLNAVPHFTLKPGSFAENLTTEGIDLPALQIGTRLQIGDTLLAVSQIGKECHRGCEIMKLIGDCVMPREGIFVRVIRNGTIRPGDEIFIDERSNSDNQ